MGYNLDRLRVLVVDRNVHIRDLLRTILDSVGAQTITQAGDAAEAFETFCQNEFDVVFTDSELAPISGLEFVDLVRRSPDSPNPYVPIIMLSGHSDEERIRMARDHGVTEFLAKPFTADIVLKRLEAVIDSPRPFIRTNSYFGPDRRRKSSLDYGGPERRKAKLAPVKLSKADIARQQRDAAQTKHASDARGD